MQRKKNRFLRSKPVWLVLRQARKIWVRAVAFAVLAVVTAVVAQLLGQFLPQSWSQQLGAGAVDQVLGILATSMLAVTTFSLSIAVSAFASAASSATPRATALLQEDHTTQNVLATFLGAFLFSLVGIVALKAGYYSQAGRLVLFATTALVIALVVGALLRWISHLTVFGRIEDTLDRVENAAAKALQVRLEHPWLGGKPQRKPPPQSGEAVDSGSIGYVLHIDMDALNEAADALGVKVWITALPGDFVHTSARLMVVDGADLDEDGRNELRKTFTCGRVRNFDQDPRFGLIVMSEIASRALSPAVNDPGTAIGVIGRLVRILSPWRAKVEPAVDYPNITVPSLTASELMEHAFRPIARDGAGNIEVQVELQKAFAALAAIDGDTFGKASGEVSRESLERNRKAGATVGEIEILEGLAAKV